MTKADYAHTFYHFIQTKGTLSCSKSPNPNGHKGCQIHLQFENINVEEMDSFIEEFHNRVPSKSFYIKLLSLQNNEVVCESSWELYRNK